MTSLKKIRTFLLLILTIVFLSACDFNSQTTITSIEVDETTLEDNYDIDTFDLSSINIKVSFSDGKYQLVPLTEAMLSAADKELLLSLGEHKITVTYQGKTTTITLNLSYSDIKKQLLTIYNLATTQGGFDGTYEDWLDSIKGPRGEAGADGKAVSLQVAGGFIQWKYVDDPSWKNLVELATLVGPAGKDGADGEDGVDGKEVTFRVAEGYIQWQYDGDDDWTNLVSLSTLTGATGADAQDVVFQAADGFIQWKYVDDPSWKNLVELATLVGPAGKDGKDGVDGKQVTFRVFDDYIQWQYVGDESWTNLVSIATLTDTAGANGKSAYEIYKENNPSYDKSESEWIEDLVNGRLATAEKTKYTVTFDSNGGSSVANQQVYENQQVTKPADPTRNGYIFEGWYVGEEQWSFVGYSVSEDIVLVARWKEIVPFSITGATYEDNVYIILVDANAETINFADIVHTDKTWYLSKNIYGTLVNVIKIALLEPGDNTFYIFEEYENDYIVHEVSVQRVFDQDPIVLATPVVIISEDGFASWGAVANASGYLYKINDGEEQGTLSLSVELQLGDSIVVKAVGDGTYTSSDWSEPITYVDLNAEPEHIETTVANLVNNLPTEEKTVIYEVTAYWTLKDGGSTYGNGWLHDGQGNQITVYGLCASDSVLTWSNGAYTYQNNKSYSSTGINNGDMITVGMVYSVQYDNYMCYLIEIVEEAGSQTYIDINFIMINDTHGAFTDSSEGNSIGRIDTLVESLEAANGDYIFIHNGDAFQGSYVCGETYGLAMIEALNASGVDCFVIGNHEFDWSIDKIAAYRDGDLTNGEANFPFLGANIYYKGTTTRPEWLDAYTIIEQDGVKVGIIGIMGPDQETSILNRYVKDYDFVEPLEIVQSTSAYLRDTLGCDVVVVAAHDYNSSMNSQFARLSGSSRIDAIFCAHTHQNIYETLTRSDSKVIPVVQCNHKNVNAAEVILKVNEEFEYNSHSATKHQIANMYTNPTTYYYEISTDVQTIIDSYQDLIDESNEVIGTVAGGLTNSTLGAYAVDAMLNYVYSSYEFEGIDMAIMNTGGVRASIDSGDITRAEVFEVFPFNNAVVLVNMSGALIKEFYGNNSGYMYMDMDDSISSYTALDDDTIYQLAVIDYVFENTRYEDQFGTLSNEDYIQTDIILRDLLMNYLDAAY